MKKLNIALAMLLAIVGVASAVGNGSIWKVGTSTNYAQVNSDGTFEASGGLASGQVTSAAIADGAIVNADINASAAIVSTKLATAVQTSLGKADTAVQPADIADVAASVIASAVDATGLTNNVTIAIQDSTDEVSQGVLQWWVSETAGGAASSNNIDSATLTTGTSIVAVNLAAVNTALSDTNGSVVVRIVMTAAGTNYINMACGGTYTSEAVVCAE